MDHANVTAVSQAAASAPAEGGRHQRLIGLMMSLFFAFGFCTVLVDTLIPKLKAVFALSFTEVMLTQFCFFGAYFIVSIPAGWLLTRIGYLRGITAGLAVMALGCLLFTPAARLGVYEGFLLALFILASGVTLVQVAANPLTARLGSPERAPSRLTLAQAFNALATMIGPVVGSALILKGAVAGPDPRTLAPPVLAAARAQAAAVVQAPFLGIAAALLGLAALCFGVRRWAPEGPRAASGSVLPLLMGRRLTLGAVSIFAYVGAEVSIGSAMASYLMLPAVLGAAPQAAGSLVSVYWGFAMVGRFIGAAALRRVPPGGAIMACALGAGVLATASSILTGVPAAACLLLVGLFNSILFPTIFTVSIENLGQDAPQGSGLLCLAIVGGAVVPLLTGVVADRFGLARALLVPVVCYGWILTYGALAHFGLAPAPEAADASSADAPRSDG